MLKRFKLLIVRGNESNEGEFERRLIERIDGRWGGRELDQSRDDIWQYFKQRLSERMKYKLLMKEEDQLDQ